MKPKKKTNKKTVWSRGSETHEGTHSYELMQPSLFYVDGTRQERHAEHINSSRSGTWGAQGGLWESVAIHAHTQQSVHFSQPLDGRHSARVLLRHPWISNHVALGIFLFFFPLRFALQTKALPISSNHNALIAAKYRGVRHRIKNVSRWPRSEISHQNCSVRWEHVQTMWPLRVHGESRRLWNGEEEA